MRKLVLLVAGLALVLSGCGKNTGNQPESPAPVGPTPVASLSPPVQAAPPAPPPHNYQMVDNGTYGYEPALSEEDVRNGTATKPLVMMRYEGDRNGTFIVLILGTDQNNPNFVNRVSCQAPCEFAKSETLSGDTVLNTETLRVTPDSIVGAMLQDAVSGQLVPYGQGQGGSHIAMPAQPVVTAQQAEPQSNATQDAAPAETPNSTADMWVGPLDMNLRSCPGTTCSALIVIPKHAKVSVETASIRNVTEASGAQTPWARVTYSGPYCDPATLDPKLGCTTLHEPGDPVTGWVNYQRLSGAPTGQ